MSCGTPSIRRTGEGKTMEMGRKNQVVVGVEGEMDKSRTQRDLGQWKYSAGTDNTMMPIGHRTFIQTHRTYATSREP